MKLLRIIAGLCACELTLGMNRCAGRIGNLSWDTADIKSGTFDDNLTWELDSTGTLTISGTGALLDQTSHAPAEPWNYQSNNIDRVVIEDGITRIGDRVFFDEPAMTSIMIPDSVKEIGDSVFYGCTALTDITASDGNPYFASLDGVLFDKAFTTLICCGGGKEGIYAIPDSVTVIGDDAFAGCGNLKDISIPDSVTSIGNEAFYECAGLTGITIPEGVKSLGEGSFTACENLTSVTLPDSLTSIRPYSFSNCSSLTSFTVPDSVTSIEKGAFHGCSGLTSITIPDSVTSIGENAFKDCFDDTLPKDRRTLTIRGYKGSCAETYANENSIPFEALG